MPTKLEEKPTEKVSTKSSAKTGENLSTAGFAIAVASIFTNFFSLGIMAIVGLVLSIMGRVQTKRAGHPSNMALAGIIISGVVMFLTFVAFVFFFILMIASSRHQIDCDTPKYIELHVCSQMYDDQSAPKQQDSRLRLNPNSL